MSTSAPIIEASIRRKAYGGKTVLENFALRVAPGEIVALLGPSGCGKSTALRIVAGLETDYEGEVRVLGKSVREPSPAVGVMFQEPRLLPWLSVGRNVAFALDGAGGATPRIEALLEEVGLAGWTDALPRALSGGMAQRVALARALFREPAVLLLDEPFGAVDALTRLRLQELLLGVVARHGTTVVLVTHDTREAVQLADRVVVLRGDPALKSVEIPVRLSRPRPREGAGSIALEAELLNALGIASRAEPGVPYRPHAAGALFGAEPAGEDARPRREASA